MWASTATTAATRLISHPQRPSGFLVRVSALDTPYCLTAHTSGCRARVVPHLCVHLKSGYRQKTHSTCENRCWLPSTSATALWSNIAAFLSSRSDHNDVISEVGIHWWPLWMKRTSRARSLCAVHALVRAKNSGDWVSATLFKGMQQMRAWNWAIY